MCFLNAISDRLCHEERFPRKVDHRIVSETPEHPLHKRALELHEDNPESLLNRLSYTYWPNAPSYYRMPNRLLSSVGRALVSYYYDSGVILARYPKVDSSSLPEGNIRLFFAFFLNSVCYPGLSRVWVCLSYVWMADQFDMCYRMPTQSSAFLWLADWIALLLLAVLTIVRGPGNVIVDGLLA